MHLCSSQSSKSIALCVCVQVVSVCWSGLQLPWLELDWFMDVSAHITQLDLSSNCLSSLPSVVPWGLISLRTLDLSNNELQELPLANNSQEVICSRCMRTLSQNASIGNLSIYFKNQQRKVIHTLIILCVLPFSCLGLCLATELCLVHNQVNYLSSQCLV